MDCLSPSSPVQRVVFMKGSQVGATEAGNGWLGYIIHQAPGPIMGVAPTVELAKRGSPGAGQGAPQPRLWQYGAQQGVPGRGADPDRRQQRRRAALHAGAVSPILLAERRSATFQRRKILLVSTPKTRGRSRIEREYEASALALDVAGIGVDLVEEGDQRRFFVPCPHCGEHQTLELANLRWPEGRPREAECGCSHCGSLIGERHKTAMLERSEWRPTAEGAGRTAGFHLSSLYSPVGWFSWADAAEMYEQAQKVPDLMKGFVNTVLGLPYEEEAQWRRDDEPVGVDHRQEEVVIELEVEAVDGAIEALQGVGHRQQRGGLGRQGGVRGHQRRALILRPVGAGGEQQRRRNQGQERPVPRPHGSSVSASKNPWMRSATSSWR
jgi:hypothetical protein